MFVSAMGWWVLPRMPISGRTTFVTSPPCLLAACARDLYCATKMRRDSSGVPALTGIKLRRDVVAPDQQDRMLRELEKSALGISVPAGTSTPSARGIGGGNSPAGKSGAALGSQPIWPPSFWPSWGPKAAGVA